MRTIDDIYDYPLYRPPSEAYSLILQITLGCSHNKCTFCKMYKGKKFTIKPFEQIKEEIDIFRKEIRYAEKIFLADGDALIIPTPRLLEILDYINEKFPERERISLYASPKSILFKTSEELKAIREKGVSLVYIGLESGDNEVLKEIKKGVTSEKIVEASLKAKEAGFMLSMTVIAGVLGDRDYTNHALKTAEVVNKIVPDYLSVLCLVVHDGTEIYDRVLRGEFREAKGEDILKEIRMMIENINIPEGKKVIFRSNHASNYLGLKGDFPEDKEKFLSEINFVINNDYIRERNDRYLRY
ncbi:MAG: B12-binding domain-containing radical SAM protein [Fusobacterium perfoetens]|nr:radical SAM protein [Fusobacterium perfoetens]MCI6153271.1 B12-binding domain-containing radical SAM protein [Fusobacterium perfoetens]